MSQSSIGPGWITCHLALKHPIIATGAVCALLGGSLAEQTNLLRADALPSKVAVITFDDGYHSDLDIAAPILAKYGFKATFYANHEGQNGDGMSPAQRATLETKFGWEQGYHSASHLDMATLTGEQLAEETAKPDGHIKAFATPFGSFNPTVIEAIKAAGYTSHVKASDSTDHGNVFPLKDPYAIDRFVYVVSSDLDALCKKPRAEKDALVVAFHQIIPNEATRKEGRDWDASAQTLEKFVKCLSDNGYGTITISELVAAK